MDQLGQSGAEMSSLPRGEGGDDPDPATSDHRGEAAAAAEREVMTDDRILCPLPKLGWSGERIARLAYLVGCGKSANEISFDPLVRATPNAIYKMMGRLNLRFREVQRAVTVQLGPAEFAALEAEASKRRMTPDSLAARVVATCASDKLFGAVIDG
jgi:hypothetical protein